MSIFLRNDILWDLYIDSLVSKVLLYSLVLYSGLLFAFFLLNFINLLLHFLIDLIGAMLFLELLVQINFLMRLFIIFVALDSLAASFVGLIWLVDSGLIAFSEILLHDILLLLGHRGLRWDNFGYLWIVNLEIVKNVFIHYNFSFIFC